MKLPEHLKGKVTDEDIKTFFKDLPPLLKAQLTNQQNIDDLVGRIELLPDTIAKGRILKVTFYDFLNKEEHEKDPHKTDRSGTCRGLLYALDEGAKVLEHEHQNTGNPEDNMELYRVSKGTLKGLDGKDFKITMCEIGDKHGIDSMPQGTFVETLKISRNYIEQFLRQFDINLQVQKSLPQNNQLEPEL